METLKELSDHDLLILLTAEVKGLREDIADMKDVTKEKIADHESRLRFIERYIWLAAGGLAILEVGIQLFK